MSFYLKIFSAELVSSWETLLKTEKSSEGISVKLSLHTLSAVLERTECKSRFLPEIPEYFPQILELMNEHFSTIHLFGHIKSSFDIFIEKCLPNIQKLLAWSRKRNKQFCGVLSNLFPWKGSSGHLECSFNRFSDKFWEEKKIKYSFLFSKTNNNFPQNFPLDTQDAVLKSFSHFYGKQVENFGSKSDTDKKKFSPQNLSVDT